MKIACQTLKETSIVKTIRLLAAEPFPQGDTWHVSSWGMGGGGASTKAIKRLPVVFFSLHTSIYRDKSRKMVERQTSFRISKFENSLKFKHTFVIKRKKRVCQLFPGPIRWSAVSVVTSHKTDHNVCFCVIISYAFELYLADRWPRIQRFPDCIVDFFNFKLGCWWVVDDSVG